MKTPDLTFQSVLEEREVDLKDSGGTCAPHPVFLRQTQIWIFSVDDNRGGAISVGALLLIYAVAPFSVVGSVKGIKSVCNIIGLQYGWIV